MKSLFACAFAALAALGVLSAASASSVGNCASNQVKIAARHVGAAGGTAGGYLALRNISRSACRVSGWPTVVGITADGKAVPAERRRSTMFGPNLPGHEVPVVVLQPGQRAEAVFTVSDNPRQGQTTCNTYRTLRVIAPRGARSVVLSAWFTSLGWWLPACGPVWITMVVPSADLYKG